jgi:hypothetical protein
MPRLICADNIHTNTFICHQAKPAQSPETRKSTRLAPNAVEKSPGKSIANPNTKARVRSCVTGTQDDANTATDPNPLTATVEPHDPTPDPLQNDPSYRSEYVGRVVSFTELATNRPAHCLVEKYITGQGYSVLCKYIDELDPPDSVQEWPLQWIEQHLVDEKTAKAWYDALTDQAKLNSPTSGNSGRANYPQQQLSAKRRRGTLSPNVPFTYAFLTFICTPILRHHFLTPFTITIYNHHFKSPLLNAISHDHIYTPF